MEEQLISFETAKLAKDKGFDIECVFYQKTEDELILCSDGIPYWNPRLVEHYYAPTQSLLQKWLRDTFETEIVIMPTFGMEKTYYVMVNREIIRDKNMSDLSQMGIMIDHKLFDTYEEALEAGLQKALKLI